MQRERMPQTGRLSEERAPYDPFVRGRFPVGVRTIHARDAARARLFPCEIWYPAAAQHHGQDVAPETQDVFAVPSRDRPRRQMAVRNGAAQPGTYPLIVFSHASMDDVEEMHEGVRHMPFTGELAWLPEEMRPIAELCSGEQAHLFVRGLTLCHMDAILKAEEQAQRFLAGDVKTELASRGVDVMVHTDTIDSHVPPA